MTVRFKIALTIFITGALTALGVAAMVLFAFLRFEHESSYYRSSDIALRFAPRAAASGVALEFGQLAQGFRGMPGGEQGSSAW